MRSEVESKHKEWYAAVKSVAEEAGVELKRPRVCGRSTHRANHPSDSASPEDYFRISITTPLLDCLLQELHSRFTDKQSIAASGLAIVPSVMAKTVDWKEKFQVFTAEYHDDMPAPASLLSELDNWSMKWSRENSESTPTTIQSTVLAADRTTFPNIFTSLAILAVMPITSSECERSASASRLLKSYLRSTIGESRLTGLALLHVHYDLAVDVNEIVDMFALKHPRKMRLKNILADEIGNN